MKSYFYLICSLFILSCAAPSKQLLHFTPGEDVNNDKYFTMVNKYYKSININIPEQELKEYTADIYMASLPPLCDVYVDSLYIGKSCQIFYLKPGPNNLTFKKNNLILNRTITLQEGTNQGKFFKLQ